jgi:hypothetical protein
MKKRSAVFLLALLGVLGTGRLADSKPAGLSSPGLPASEAGYPPIDGSVPARLATATFALG